MDASLKHLDRIRERGEATNRKLGMSALAAATVLLMVFGLGVALGGGPESEDAPAPVDPLARLARSDQGAGESVSEADVAVDETDLTFPNTLLENDPRPEVAAALAAAAAEHAHPDPLAEQPSEPADEAKLPAVSAERLPIQLPAAVAASSTEVLGRAAAEDPLVASALASSSSDAKAPRGHDGRYTLQVISYQSPAEARRFAEALRARDHRAFVTTAKIPGRGQFWRVRIGPFESMREAQSYREEFEAAEQMNTFVVHRHPDAS